MNLINGLSRKYVEGTDAEYIYYSKNMLEHNLIIAVDTFAYEDSPDGKEWSVETWINVQHFNDIDAFTFTMYSGDYLQEIQVYRIVKDIYDLYLDNELSDFLKIIHELSVGFQSQSLQSKKENAIDVRNGILSDFEKLNW
ncbi:hypothetical protein [Bacillus sp. PS06]|uniref:hypothetical protein n=1 Tax=Bacillus sp. PS06 TaxID=2764176 RepID=UPI00177E0CFE|nr:hypothetical protein [Bacillus sp. PS06]MBD8069797.1 hypothetical protein [Bacillus sp. PS06]